MKKEIVVMYHENCPDGFGAAWAAWKKFKERAQYIPVPPRELPQKPLKNKEVYVLDNSFSKKVLGKLAKDNRKVIVIDHHESSKNDILSFPQNVYNKDHSAAYLTWRYFHPLEKVPTVIKYIEDVDLWRFSIKGTEYFSSYIRIQPHDFRKWSSIAKDFEDKKKRESVLAQGKNIKDYEDVVVEKMVKKASFIKLGRYKILAVNSGLEGLNSAIGHALYEKNPPFSLVWDVTRDIIHVSLRSDGTVDVSKIAAKFGGGGHKAAAGFFFPIKKGFPWKFLNERID